MRPAIPSLTPLARQALVTLVRNGLVASVRGGAPILAAETRPARDLYPELNLPQGAFLTLSVDHALRGCLGEVNPQGSLLDVLLRLASRVPIADTRFAPIRPEELESLTFKIAILHPLAPVRDLEEIRLGRDGLFVRHGRAGGLLLPNVPIDHGWNLQEFLRHLWCKARIPEHIPWSATELFRFTTETITSDGET